MVTYRLDLAYNGSGFYGYAIQPDVRTVQGELEAALAPHTGAADTFVAGRTDRGVHASGQVVSFTCHELDTARVLRSLNSQLAPEIAARRLREVPAGFHARFSATGRAYRYRIGNSAVHDPLSAVTTWTFTQELDVDAMNRAVEPLVGVHDFVAFCRKREGESTARDVFWVGWRRTGEIVEFSIGANAFCHQMVRSIVGLSVEVGRGRMSLDAVPGIAASTDRHRATGSAPPHGLVLVAVAYEHEPLLKPSWIPESS